MSSRLQLLYLRLGRVGGSGFGLIDLLMSCAVWCACLDFCYFGLLAFQQQHRSEHRRRMGTKSRKTDLALVPPRVDASHVDVNNHCQCSPLSPAFSGGEVFFSCSIFEHKKQGAAGSALGFGVVRYATRALATESRPNGSQSLSNLPSSF